MKSALILAFALAAAPLAAQQQAAALPEHPAALPGSPFTFDAGHGSRGANDLIGGTVAFLQDHRAQKGAGWGTALQQDITGRLAFRIGETRTNKVPGIPADRGLGVGVVLNLGPAKPVSSAPVRKALARSVLE